MTSPNANGTFPDECTRLRNETFRAGIITDVDARPNGAAAQFVWWSVFTSLLCLFVAVFATFKYALPSRAKYSRIQHRPMVHIVITHFGAALSGLVCSWFQTRRIDEGLPCWMILTAYFFQIPCLVFPLIARSLAFYREAQWTAAVLVTSSKMDKEHKMDVSSAVGTEPEKTQEFPSEITFLDVFRYLIFSKRIPGPRADRAERVRPHETGDINTDGQSTALSSGDRVDLRILKFLKSDFGAYLTMFLIFTPFMLTLFIMLGINPLVSNNCIGCYPSLTHEYVLTTESVIVIVLLIMCYRLNFRRHDPLGIVNEIRLAVWIGGVPGIIFNIVNNALRPTQEQNDFQLAIMIEASLLVFCFCQSGLQVILAINDRFKQSKAMAQTNFKLADFEEQFLMKGGKFTEAFSKHLISEHGYESEAFLTSVYSWEREFFDVNPRTVKTRAKKICRTYVGDTAELPCNLSSNCVRRIKEILDKDEDVQYDLFKDAKTEITNMLYGDAFRRFVSSKDYNKLALASSSEMVQSVNANEAS